LKEAGFFVACDFLCPLELLGLPSCAGGAAAPRAAQ